MNWAAPLIALLFSAQTALALSCRPITVEDIFNQAADAPESYVVVQGVLKFDMRKLPKSHPVPPRQTQPTNLIAARITGMSLGMTGFKQAFQQPVTLNAACFGPWCSHPQSGVPYLTFLRQTADGYHLDITPCGGFAIANPSQQQLTTVTKCLRQGRCPAP